MADRHIWHPYAKRVVRWKDKIDNPYRMAEANRPTSFVCWICGMESFHPEDVAHGYCANCHRYSRNAK
jgi:ribosomal protein L37E